MEAKSTIWGTLPAPTRSSKRTRKEQKIKNHHRRNPKPQKKKKKNFEDLHRGTESKHDDNKEASIDVK
jgi:hypothetical protein